MLLVVEKKSSFLRREVLKCHESFAIFVSEESLSIIKALWRLIVVRHFTLKSLVLEQVFGIKKTMQDLQELPNNKETNNRYVTSLNDERTLLKKENKTKNIIIQILSENQSCFSK